MKRIHQRLRGDPVDAQEPIVQVKSVHSVKLIPFHSTIVSVQVPQKDAGLLLQEPGNVTLPMEVEAQEGLMQISTAHATLQNKSGFTQWLDKDMVIGQVSSAEMVDLEKFQEPQKQGKLGTRDHGRKLYKFVNAVIQQVQSITKKQDSRERKLLDMLKLKDCSLKQDDQTRLKSVLVTHHEAFSLSPDERGETDLVQLAIKMGDAPAKRLPVRRVPFAVQRELV